MGEVVPVIAGQIFVMFVLMALGFVLYRAHFITDAGASQMSDLVLYVANPVLILQALMRPFEARVLINAAWVALIVLISMAIGLVVARLTYPSLDKADARLARFSVLFCNSGFIGIPLIQATLGGEYVFYMSVANSVMIAVLWSYGVWLVSGDPDDMSARKVLTNPCVLALFVGLAFFLLSYEPPKIVSDALDALANLNTGLVMLVLGAYLGECDVLKLLRDGRMYKVSLLRLVAVPGLTIVALWAFFRFLDPGVLTTVVIYASAPVAAVASLFSHKWRKESGEFATGAVAFSTLFSLVTMPLMVALASAVL